MYATDSELPYFPYDDSHLEEMEPADFGAPLPVPALEQEPAAFVDDRAWPRIPWVRVQIDNAGDFLHLHVHTDLSELICVPLTWGMIEHLAKGQGQGIKYRLSGKTRIRPDGTRVDGLVSWQYEADEDGMPLLVDEINEPRETPVIDALLRESWDFSDL